jgi:Tfp pilus assembly PilM family ATPase
MPLEQAVLAHRVLERINDGDHPRMRVLVVGARLDSVNHLLAVARRAGLHPELVDLSAFAMIRALYVPRSNGDEPVRHEEPVYQEPVYVEPEHAEPVHAEASGDVDPLGYETPLQHVGEADGEPLAVAEPNGASVATVETPSSLATVYCYIGGLTNLAIAVGTNCVFNRVLHNGIESMAATLAERKGLTLDHSREWLRYVGLERDLQNIEGEQEIIAEAREVLENGARRIADEVRLSMEYYHSTVPDAPRVDAAVMAGPGIAITGLNTLFEQHLGMPVEARSMGKIDVQPGALDGVDGPSLTVATGLALDEVTS